MNEPTLDIVLNELVIANRILANEGVVDAYGHVSVRHPGNPERFFQARMLAPELVERGDLMEFGLDGQPVSDSRAPSVERFIHSAIYEGRPEVQGVVHAHAEDILPFGITDVPLRPVIHSGSFIGRHVPVWDIAENFGDTDLLVRDMSQGRDLARRLGDNNVVLMRGHGFAAAARSIIEAVRVSVYLPRNARVQLAAMQLGKYKPLSDGEIAARASGYKPYSTQTWRAWEYWANRAGCGHMLGERPVSDAKKSEGG
ncbi:MAG TPA: class II aldolase/adducin family protein [Terriglobia bacterium]|nr:class II aldolase/adducin family protein [Terriglobia bacterium]